MQLNAQERLEKLLKGAQTARADSLIHLIRDIKLNDLVIEPQSTLVVRAIFYNHRPFVFQMQLGREESKIPVKLTKWQMQEGAVREMIKLEFALERSKKELGEIIAKTAKLTSQGSLLFKDAENRRFSGSGIVVEILTPENYVIRTIEFDDSHGLDKRFMESDELALLSQLSALCALAEKSDGKVRK